MFEDISKLGSSDPKVGKAAALSIVQHVSENKTELGYLVKRLVSGLESTKIPTRTGCYTTLSILLNLRKLNPVELFDLSQKALVTNKQSTKKERRLIYIARILCSGSIIKSTIAADLAKTELLQNLLHDLVDLSLKKSSYFQLSTPFLVHLLSDNTLTQEVFDGIVWPKISELFEGSGGKKKKKAADDDGEDEETDGDSVNLTCRAQLALCCKVGDYQQELDGVVGDMEKIVRGLLASRPQFTDSFLKSLFQCIKDSHPDMETFWTTLVEHIKPTQFDLLCVSVEKAVEQKLPLSIVISKKLLRLLLSVFKSKDTEFHGKSRKAISLLLNWRDVEMKKKDKKEVIGTLFGGEAPCLLHEYRRLSSVVRGFIHRLEGKDLEILRKVIFGVMEDEAVGARMVVTCLNVLGRIGGVGGVTPDTFFEIGKKLISVGIGTEVIEVKGKEGEEVDDNDRDEVQALIRSNCVDSVRGMLGSGFHGEGVKLIGEWVLSESKSLVGGEEGKKALKDVKKLVKHCDDPIVLGVVYGFVVKVVLDGKSGSEDNSSAVEGLRELIEAIKGKEDFSVGLVKVLLGRAVGEVGGCVSVEGVFSRLLVEGKVKDEVVQEIAGVLEEFGDGGAGEEVDDEEESGDEDESSEEEDDEEGPSAKVPKLDPAQIAKLKEAFGEGMEGSDSEESIPLEDASAEDLKKMDGALAKVFAIKKSVKEQDSASLRGLMRVLRIVEMWVNRNLKCMDIGGMLMLLNPVVGVLKGCAGGGKKREEMVTRVISVVDSFCRIKKFSGGEGIDDGVISGVMKEVYEVGTRKKFRVFREIFEHLVLLLLRAFLSGGKEEGDSRNIIKLFGEAADEAKGKLKRRKKRKGANEGGLETSRFVRAGLEVIGDGWGKGKKAIEGRVKGR